jgi:ParB-like chromosome segregation protein Spo0J
MPTVLTKTDATQVIPIQSLIAWDRNPRLHPDDNVAKIAASIRRFGLVRLPVIATWPDQTEGVIIAGNGVLAALRLLHQGQPHNPPAGVTPDWGIPVRPAWFPSKLEAEAYGLADNWIAENSQDDPAAVGVLLGELEIANVDVETLGKDLSELKAIMDPISPEDVAWKEFDETVGKDAPKGREVTCPHCGETFTK